MLLLNAETIRSLAFMPRLVDSLEEAFRNEWVVPARTIVEIPGGTDGRLFVSMPVFDLQGAGAVKLVTLFPGNRTKGLPTVQAVIVVVSDTGSPFAILDGTIVTNLRTGAASALASKYLSRHDSTHLVMMGTGALAPYMALAHCAVRPITRISVWGRHPDRVALTVTAMGALLDQVDVRAATTPEKAVAEADIVSCATSSATPVLAGKWLKEGSFVDLVGSFSPTARESDDDVMRRSRIFVDTRAGAFAEAGDILDPLSRGVISKAQIEGDLFDLVRGSVKARQCHEEITLFKSVGTAIEDVAAARMIVASHANLDAAHPRS